MQEERQAIGTCSSMVKFSHHWNVGPSEFKIPCPSCEFTTGTTKWLLNCCTQTDGDGGCSKCNGPYLMLLSAQGKDAIISVSETGTRRKVKLGKDTYSLQPKVKLPLNIVNTNDPDNQGWYRYIITVIQLYENRPMTSDELNALALVW